MALLGYVNECYYESTLRKIFVSRPESTFARRWCASIRLCKLFYFIYKFSRMYITCFAFRSFFEIFLIIVKDIRKTRCNTLPMLVPYDEMNTRDANTVRSIQRLPLPAIYIPPERPPVRPIAEQSVVSSSSANLSLLLPMSAYGRLMLNLSFSVFCSLNSQLARAFRR